MSKSTTESILSFLIYGSWSSAAFSRSYELKSSVNSTTHTSLIGSTFSLSGLTDATHSVFVSYIVSKEKFTHISLFV